MPSTVSQEETRKRAKLASEFYVELRARTPQDLNDARVPLIARTKVPSALPARIMKAFHLLFVP